MSMQRRRGREVEFFGTVERTSRRGDTVKVPSDAAAWVTRCSESAERSSRAELPGQQGIDVITIRVSAARDVALFDRARYRNLWWDVVAPPSVRNGSRHVQHQTVLLRRRPDSGGVHG